MKSVPWVRSDLIREIRHDLWRYLTPAANIEHELLEASALLRMSPAELRTLGQLQFLISPELGHLLDVLPTLVRRLTTTTTSEEELSLERVRGSIQWARTLGLRYATGLPHLYVSAPARRAYQTPENELLVFLLDATIRLGELSGWHRSAAEDVGKLVNARVALAQRWSQSRMLLGVERFPPTSTKLARIRTGRFRRRYQAVLDAYRIYRQLLARLDRASIRRAVETYGLVSRDDATLFELLCTFRVIEGLRQLGWTLGRLGLFAGTLRLVGERDGERLELTYQAVPRGLGRTSVYRTIQQLHALTPGALRPDLVIHRVGPNGERWLLIEVKGGGRAGEVSARAAAYDLLAYRTAFAPVLDGSESPYGLGIAWGAALDPTQEGDVVLCTPDTLSAAMAHLFS